MAIRVANYNYNMDFLQLKRSEIAEEKKINAKTKFLLKKITDDYISEFLTKFNHVPEYPKLNLGPITKSNILDTPSRVLKFKIRGHLVNKFHSERHGI